MESKTLSQVGRADHIPEDLWRNILSRLPSKSLVRFRCISKLFQSLINDPDFRRLHLKSFKNNVDESLILVVKEEGQENSEVRCSKTWEIKSEEAVHYNLGPNWHGVRSLDGLVLLRNCERNFKGLRDLKLWNPSIRKFHDLPPVPETETCVEHFFTDAEIGLGYDPLIKDYKHVKFIFKDDNVVHLVAVYTLGVGSWKIIPFQGEGFSDWHLTWRCTCGGAVYLRGSLYFLSGNQDKQLLELVWIDLSSMLFSSTRLPDAADIRAYDPMLMLTLADGGCSLAVWSDFTDAYKPIWVLETESMTWTKRYSVHVNDPCFIWSRASDSIEHSDLFSFNLVTKEKKILHNKVKKNLSEILPLCGYVESLILLN